MFFVCLTYFNQKQVWEVKANKPEANVDVGNISPKHEVTKKQASEY